RVDSRRTVARSGASMWGSSPTTGNSLVNVGMLKASESDTESPGVGDTAQRSPTARATATARNERGTDYREPPARAHRRQVAGREGTRAGKSQPGGRNGLRRCTRRRRRSEHSAQEVLGALARGIVEDLGRGPLLHDRPLVEPDHPVGDLLG